MPNVWPIPMSGGSRGFTTKQAHPFQPQIGNGRLNTIQLKSLRWGHAMCPLSKSDKVRGHLLAGEVKEALRLANIFVDNAAGAVL